MSAIDDMSVMSPIADIGPTPGASRGGIDETAAVAFRSNGVPKVLLLHDDATLCAELQRALSPLGCAFTVIRDGVAGLARAVSDPFDLILASVELPGVNGFRLCNRVKKDPAAAKTPVFLVTSRDHGDSFKRHQRLGTRAEAYFQEPLQMAELVARAKFFLPQQDSSPGGAQKSARPAEARSSVPSAVSVRPLAPPRPATASARPSAPTDIAAAQALYQLQQTLRERQAELSRVEKLLAVGQAERAQSSRRLDELSARLATSKSEIDAATRELADERAARSAEQAASAAKVEQAVALAEQIRRDAEARLARELATWDLAREADLAHLRADLESTIAVLERDLTSAQAATAEARADVAKAEHRAREEADRAAERIAADAERERQKLLSELEGERGRQGRADADVELRAEELALARVRKAEEEGERRLAEAKQRLVQLEQRRRQEGAENSRALDAALSAVSALKEQRATEAVNYRQALELAANARESDRVAAEKRVAKQQGTLSETFAARDELHARELAEVRSRYEVVLESLRKEIENTRAQGEEAREFAVARRDRELEGLHQAALAGARREHAAELQAKKRAFDEQKQGLQAQIEASTAAGLAAERKFRVELADRDQKLVELQKKLASLEEERARLRQSEQRLTEALRTIDEERAARHGELAKHAREVANADAEHARQRDVWSRRLTEQQAAHAVAMAAKDAEHADELARERAMHEAALDDVRVDVERIETEERLGRALAAEKEARAADALLHAGALAELSAERDRERSEVAQHISELQTQLFVAAAEAKTLAAELSTTRAAHVGEVERLEALVAAGADQETALTHAADSERKLRVAVDVRAAHLEVARAQAIGSIERKVEELRAEATAERDAKRALERELVAAREAHTEREQALRDLERRLAAVEEQGRGEVEQARRKNEELGSSFTYERERAVQERAALEKLLAELGEMRDKERVVAEQAASDAARTFAETSAERDRAHAAALAALAADHDKALLTQRCELEMAEAAAIETRESEIVALRRKLEEQAASSEAKAQELAAAFAEQKREEQAALVQRAKESAAADAREQMQKQTRDLLAEREERVRQLTEKLASSERRAESEVAEQKRRLAAAVAESDRARVLAQLERDRAMSDLQLKLSAELAEAERGYERKLATAKEAARRAALSEGDDRNRREIEELTRQWQSELAAERQLRDEIVAATRGSRAPEEPLDDDLVEFDSEPPP